MEKTKMNYANLGKYGNKRFSLLYPEGIDKDEVSFTLSKEVISDLNLEGIINFMQSSEKSIGVLKSIIYKPLTDIKSIEYRQNIIEDLIKNQSIINSFEEIISNIEILETYNQQNLTSEVIKRQGLSDIKNKLMQIEHYFLCVEKLSEGFGNADNKIESEGLKMLKNVIEKVKMSHKHAGLKIELPKVVKELENCKTLIVEVYLNERLYPEKAAIVKFGNKRIVGNNLINNTIFKGTNSDKIGIGTLYKLPKRLNLFTIEDDGTHNNNESQSFFTIAARDSGKMTGFLEDLLAVSNKISKPIIASLSSYISENILFLIKLKKELLFYIDVVKLLNRISQNNLPICKPKFIEKKLREFKIENSYNLNLAKEFIEQNKDVNQIVFNDIEIGDKGRILVLTGPNSGGKTVYMEGIGVAQVLAQCGLFVAGDRAKISPVENIYTHYQTKEEREKRTGRLGQEAARVKMMFENINKNTLILMNESFSSTSEVDSVYIAQDIISALRNIGARVVYTTHLLRLGEKIDKINREIPGESKIVSMVAKVEMDNRENMKMTYKIEPRKPLESSYSKNIVVKYGITYEQLEAKFKRHQAR